MDYSQFLYELNKHIWGGYIVALLTTYLCRLGNKSYYFGSIVVVILTLAMLALEPVLTDLSSDYPWFIWYAWYPTWATFDVVGVLLIYILHRREQQRVEFVSVSCMITLVVLSSVQCIRYVDMVILEMDFMGTGYRLLINTLNIGLLFTLASPLLKHAHSKILKATA